MSSPAATADLFDFGVISAAHVSPCERYRYTLTRVWAIDGPQVCWICLNPSTADARANDPSIRRMIGFSKAWGCGGIIVVNLFALRSTDPKALRGDPDPVGPENDQAILAAAVVRGRRVVAGWGCHGTYRDRDRAVAELLVRAGVTVECLGRTKDGHPKHPLYLGGDVVPRPWFWPTRKGGAA